ncbi:hypothetical protein [Variovorax sp. GT1P44]|uniref:hypothetical protein n=1 Tax=Variovorax sp. GT1P44 TaxID=3443742 RepID=UPI003F488449
MIRIHARVAMSGALLATALAAGAAPTAADLSKAQQRHDQQIAKCNDGSLAAPARDACVREAGAELDRARGAPPRKVTKRSTDRRSTVVTPQGASAPSGTETARSGDRRSTVVTPQGTQAPAGSETVRSNDRRSTVVQPAQ